MGIPEDFTGARWTIAEVAAQLGISRDAVEKWIRCGVRGVKLRSILIGTRRYVPQRALLAFLRETGNDLDAPAGPVAPLGGR